MKFMCKKCGEILCGDTNYEIKMCSCGALAVDGGPNYARIIANQEDFETIGDEIMKYRYIARTSQGGRTENQDAVTVAGEVLTDEKNTYNITCAPSIYAVFDGVGGEPNGRETAEAAATELANQKATMLDLPSVNLKAWLAGGASTVAGIAMVDRGQGIVFHVGDSRVYRIRNGKIEYLTRDDVEGIYRVDNGSMTAMELRQQHPAITKCLGMINLDVEKFLANHRLVDDVVEEAESSEKTLVELFQEMGVDADPQCSTRLVDVEFGDRYFLLTDGAWEILEEYDWHCEDYNFITADVNEEYDQRLNSLLKKAARDNFSYVLIEII